MLAASDHPFSDLRVDPQGWLGPTVVSGESQVLQGRVTTESFLVSAQGHHLVELSDAADNDCELAAFFRLTRSALQAGDALKQQVMLIDLVVPEGHIHPLFVGIGHDTAGVSAGAPLCFGHKGRKFREADPLIDFSHRPFVALLLLLLRHPLGGHNRPAPMNASSTSAKAAGSRSMSAMVC